MKKNDIITLHIEQYAFEGKGISKIDLQEEGTETNDKFVVFVQGGYPGDTVKVRIRKKKKRYAEAKVMDVLEKSPERTEARCSYFGVCGGCKQQDMKYEVQTKYKEQQVVETITKLAKTDSFDVEPIIPSENIFFYRNKMEYSFADKRWLSEAEKNSDTSFDNNFAVGLHVPRIFDKVIDIKECFLQSEISNAILNFTRDFFKERNTTIYSTKTHTGYLRNLVIRQSANTDDLMVNLVTNGENEDLLNEYTETLIKCVPQVTTVLNNINTGKASVATGEYEIPFFGDGVIYDKIGEYKFRISANSFFQTNTKQAEELYKTALEFSGLTGKEIVYDLYCGAGTISQYISKHSDTVYGFEVVESAIQDANINKELNNITNAHFYQADLYKSFLPIIKKNGIPNPDVMMIDPPRSGMHKNTVADVIECNPKTIVYVSCNPATQARDIELLIEGGYKLIKIRPVDMFPHTYHIENVALLVKEG